MNFPADHIERVKEFGYSESEARFLYIVAVHSGYFTLGQFRHGALLFVYMGGTRCLSSA
jgi:hypothetical protein